MHIGSSASATIPVKHIKAFLAIDARILSLVYFLLLNCSCHEREPMARETTDAGSTIDCGTFCSEHQLKVFDGGKLHIEVEEIGRPAQIFYNVDPANLYHGLSLSPHVTISGVAQGASAFLKLDAQSKRDNPASFADIIAIPIANKINYLSPPLPLLKSKLQSDQTYALEIQSRLDYVFILNPNGLYGRAPIFLKPGPLERNTTLNFDVTQKTHKLIGHVQSSDINFLASIQVPQIKARVMQGNRLVSSSEAIKKDGTIILELSETFLAPPGDVPLMLIIEPQDRENALPRLQIKLDKELMGTDINIGTIDLGKLNPPFKATLEILGEDKTIIGNATVFMRANVGTGTSFVKKQIDASGLTIFNQLYEGNYDIAVIPPFISPFAMKLIKNFKLTSSPENTITIELPLRKLLYGTVVDSENAKVNGAQIELSRIGKIGDFATEDIFDDMLFNLTVTTNEDGRICQRSFGFETSNKNECSPLTLDEGRYLAHIIPPSGSKLAHHWLTFDFPRPGSLEIKLKSPQVVVGKIVGADRITPIKNAFITVYLAQNYLPGPSKVVANAITDDSGIFRAFIFGP